VVTLHDVQHHDLPGLFSRAERAYRRWAYDGSARRAGVVVTSSNFSKGRIVELVGVEPERVEVVHFGIDTERFAPGPVEDDEEALHGLELPERFAFYPANLWPHKNHERLLEALALLRDTELGLVLTGQDYGRLDRLRERARDLGVDARMHHLGHVGAEALPALYRRAGLLVFPSLYEGFGAPPLEAMASGCPVAASERASIPEVCGEAALYFNPESAESIAATVRTALEDEDVRARLRSHGLERTKAFTWRVAAERHQAIYERAAET
jgi:glycosyltransferase involved in cell wall biosynthesis